MTPQSSFFVLAPIIPAHEAELRRILASMNEAPGRLKAANGIIPFADFDTLHVARLLIVDDGTVADNEVYGLPRPVYPKFLGFLGDVDGEGDDFLAAAAARAGDGLRRLFACCEGFTPQTDLVSWMKAHDAPSSANYVNWHGRTVRRVHEEAALRDAIEAHVKRYEAELQRLPATNVHAKLRQLVQGDIDAGRLTLSPEAPTPMRWWIRDALHLASGPLILALVLLPFLWRPWLWLAVLVALGLALVLWLRHLEKTDPELCWKDDPVHARELADIEDHDVTNQFSAMGSLKPGLFRLGITRFVLFAIDWFARHVYTRGGLGRVRTIHFARWAFIAGPRRILFASNYDGSLESYMDDFINKVGFGLNVVFSNGIGYPRAWLLLGQGCKDERKFKEYLRRHQMPTQVWYKAYPGLTAIDLERNTRIREGIDAASMSERDAREWVALL